MTGAVIAAGGADIHTITVVTVNVDRFGGAASYALQNAGNILHNGIDSGDWIVPKDGFYSDYEAKMDLVSGSLVTGTTGSWLNLGTTRSWGSSGFLGTLSVRRVSDAVVLKVVTIELNELV